MNNYILVFFFGTVVLGWTILFEKILGVPTPGLLYGFMIVYVLVSLLLGIRSSVSSYAAAFLLFCIPFAVLGRRPDIADFFAVIAFMLSLFAVIRLFFKVR